MIRHRTPHTLIHWLVALPLLTSTACATKGKDAMQEFDQKYQQVLSQTLSRGELARRPCPATVDQRDYRYLHCFYQQSGSGTVVRDHLVQTFEKAGFVQEKSAIHGNDLDAVLRLPGTPYSVNIYFTSSGVQWHALQDGVGKIPPFQPEQGKTPYALTTPQDAARLMAMGVLYHARFSLKDVQSNKFIQDCGQAVKNEASVCLTWAGQKDTLRTLILQEFFAGEERWLSPLESKPTFEYRQEPLYAEMIADGTLSKGAKSPMLLKKLSAGSYLLRDTAAWPGFEFEFSTAGVKTDQVKVTARLLGTVKP